MSYNLLQEAIRAREGKEQSYEPTHEYMKCVTVTVGSSVEPTDRPGYRWVQELNQPGSVLQVFGPNCPKIAGLPVLVGYGPKPPMRLQILFVDLSIVAELPEYDGSPYLGPHAQDHEWPDFYPGHDPMTVYPRAWSQLRVNPTNPASLSVEISPLTYPTAAGAATYGGGVKDLTSNVPGTTGQARLVLIYLDVVTNTIGTSNGAVGPAADGWMLDEPTLPSNVIPSALVRLENGQTTITEPSVMDRRLFLRGTSGMGWPFSTQVITVDTTDPDADVATIALAIAAAAAGDLILASPETHVCDNQSLTTGVNLAGLDRDATLLQTTGQTVTLTLNNNCYVFQLTINNAQSNAAAITALLISGATVELRDVVVTVNNSGAGDGRAISVGAGVTTLRLEDCDAEAVSGAGDGYALYSAAGSGTIEVRGGKYDGDTADIYAGAGVTIVLYGPTLVNSTFAGTGIVKGWYYDVDGDLIPIDHSMLGDMVFNEADGLLLLDFQRWEQHGSGAARANYVVGSRLERARVGVANAVAGSRGALHFESGRWQNKCGLVIEKATTNLVPNPSLETNITGWSAPFGNSTLVRVITEARYGTACGKLNGATNFAYSRSQHAGIAVAASTAYTFSVWVKAVAAADIGKPLLLSCRFDVTGEQMQTGFTLTSQWQRLVATKSSGVGDSTVRLAIVIHNDSTGVDFYFDGAQLEAEGCATTYCDGEQGDGYSWSGVNHASTSSRAASYVLLDDYADFISDNNTMSFRIVAQMPYDYDATWPPAGNSNPLFEVRGADNNNYISLSFRSDLNAFAGFLNGAWRLLPTSFAFSAGDWIEFVFTLDFTNDEYKLYIDGGLKDTDTTPLTAPTAMADWVLGDAYSHPGTLCGGYTFAEYAAFDRVLTATEVAILFAEQRPLIDCAAIENRPTVPGVSAGVWEVVSAFTSAAATYTEVYQVILLDGRITFAGSWVCGLIQFEASLDRSGSAGTGYVKLQYYDTANAAWRDIPGSEFSTTSNTPNRRRTPPLVFPEQEYEYRVVAWTTPGAPPVMIRGRGCKIIVSPGGDYDNL